MLDCSVRGEASRSIGIETSFYSSKRIDQLEREANFRHRPLAQVGEIDVLRKVAARLTAAGRLQCGHAFVD